MKLKKLPDRKKLKKRAWGYFSKYVRQRDATKEGYVKCCTCGVYKHWKEMDAGHFLQGRHESVLFSETNSHPQCPKCNRFMQGRWQDYYRYMENRYGKPEIDRLMSLDRKVVPLSVDDLYKLIDKYKALIQ